MTQEIFKEAWGELSREEKIACFNEYAREYNCDDELFEFDDDFFNTFYNNDPAGAVRAAFFGNISSWSDEYLRFNGYGNIVSLNEYEAEEWADDHVDEIFEYEEIWSQYIDASDYEDDDEEDDE